MNPYAIADSGPWSLGTLIWLPVCGLLVLVGLVIAGLALIPTPNRSWGVFSGAMVGVFLLVLGTALPVIGMYPYSAEYHQWREVSGPIEKIDRRLVSDGDKGMSEKIVVRIDGQQFGCTDTRCAGASLNDTLTLACKRVWVYASTDGYDCNFRSLDPSNTGTN